MREFFLLLKCDLLRIVRGGKAKGKAGKLVLSGGVIVILSCFIALFSGVYSGLFAMALPNESKYLSLSIITALYCLLFLFSMIGSAKSLFGATDYDFLASLPIKSRVVILSKLAYLYVIGIGSAIICFIPATVVFMIVAKCGAIALLNAVLLIPFIPLVPIVIGLIIGTFVSILGSKIKRKGVFGALVMGIFLGAYFYFAFTLDLGETDEEFALALLSISSVLAPFSFIAKALIGNFLNLIIFVLLTTLVAFAYVAILGKYYNKVNGLITSKRVGSAVNISKQKGTSVVKSLIKKELKAFVSNSTLILNVSFGPVMVIILAVVYLFNGGINGVIGALPAEFEEIKQIIPFVKIALPYIPFLMLGIATYSAFSISFEGKNFWLIKSLPISGKDWLNAKLIMNLILTLPAGVISVILFSIGTNIVWYDLLIYVVIVCLYTLFGGLLGLTVDLKFHDFTWTNVVQIVKQGHSMTICFLLGFVFAILVVALQILGTLVSPYLGYALVAILLCAMNLLFYKLAYGNIERKIASM